MAVEYGANIVTDGLVLCLDAGNKKSYPGSGSTWYDISGNGNHHTLVGNPTYSSGALTFDGSTQGVLLNSALNNLTTVGTVVLWYKTSDIQELWVMGNNSTSWYLSASNNNTYYHSNCGSPTNYVDLTAVSNPYASGYKNNAYHMWEAKYVNFTSWTRFDWFSYPSGWQLGGTVTNIMVYNRVLSDADSKQNFTALRNRHGV